MNLTPDMINGTLELCGGLMQVANVRRLLRDKMVRGVSWPFTAFFAGWGVWNCYYYPSLGQWCSFAGGMVIVFANAIWVALAIHYSRRESYQVTNNNGLVVITKSQVKGMELAAKRQAESQAKP